MIAIRHTTHVFPWRRFAVIACAAVFSAAACGGQPATADRIFSAALSDLDDKPTTLAQWKGRPFVVNFWARWCAPCRKEMPDFVKARVRNRDRGVEMLGLALEEQGSAVRDFARAGGIDYPILLLKDDAMGLMSELGNTKLGLPFTLAVDRQGRIAYVKLGPMSAADMDAAFAAAAR